MCSAVPDAPQSVKIVSSLPTEILVSVEPPHEDGGMPVTGYRVEFEDQAQDFDVGQSLVLTLRRFNLSNCNLYRFICANYIIFLYCRLYGSVSVLQQRVNTILLRGMGCILS